MCCSDLILQVLLLKSSTVNAQNCIFPKQDLTNESSFKQIERPQNMEGLQCEYVFIYKTYVYPASLSLL